MFQSNTMHGLAVAVRFNMLEPADMPIAQTGKYNAFDLIFLLRVINPKTHIEDMSWLRNRVTLDKSGDALITLDDGVECAVSDILNVQFAAGDGEFTITMRDDGIEGMTCELVSARCLRTDPSTKGSGAVNIMSPVAYDGCQTTPQSAIEKLSAQIRKHKPSDVAYIMPVGIRADVVL